MEIKHNRVSCSKKTSELIQRALEKGRLNYIEDIENFERKIENHLGAESGSCIAVSSGSIALLLAIYLLKSKAKKFYIPSYTCKSISSSISFYKIKNIEFIDSSKNDYPSFKVDKIKENEIAIIPHMLGYVNKVKKSNFNNVIEDISQCIDGRINNKFVGSQSRFGILSLYATKQLSGMGGGGVLYCYNKKDQSIIRNLIDLNSPFKKGVSLNMRMTGINCLYAITEFDFLEENIEKRKNIRNLYKENGLNIVFQTEKDIDGGNYRAIIKSKNPKRLIQHLKNNSIQSIQPYIIDELPEEAKGHVNTMQLIDSLVSLPCYPGLEELDIKRISDKVKELENK